MIYIAHRGNYNGINKDDENHPDYILVALAKGYDAEIDVWWHKNQFYLGHDEPTHPVVPSFILNRHMWCHAKNIEALEEMFYFNAHCFMHDQDMATLTSENFIWTYRMKESTPRSICVLPERTEQDFKNAAGICSDLVEKYKNDQTS